MWREEFEESNAGKKKSFNHTLQAKAAAPRDYAEVDKKCVCVKETMLGVIFNIFSAFERAK